MTGWRAALRGLRGLAMGAALLAAACGQSGGVSDVGAAPTQAPAAAAPAVPNTDIDTGTPDATATQPVAGADDGTTAPEMTSVTVYLTRGENVAAVTRRVPRVARIGRAAVEQLLAGPTPQEAADGYGTAIPAGTRVRDLAITDGVATVDLSADFEEGGGTLGLTLRLAQVACTLDEFPTVAGVRFALDGTVVDVFSGDGLIVDEPVACDDYPQVAAPSEISVVRYTDQSAKSRPVKARKRSASSRNALRS